MQKMKVPLAAPGAPVMFNIPVKVSVREKARGSADAPRPMPKRAPNPMYREYDKVGHDSWTPAYRFGDDGVLDWMFAQRRISPTSTP